MTEKRDQSIPVAILNLGHGPIVKVEIDLFQREDGFESGYKVLGTQDFSYELTRPELLAARSWLRDHPTEDIPDKPRVIVQIDLFSRLMGEPMDDLE